MNKGDLINKLAADCDFSKEQAKSAVECVLGSIEGALKAGEKAAFIGFGTFSVNHRPERQGINPATKQPITIKAKNVIKFKAGKALGEAVN